MLILTRQPDPDPPFERCCFCRKPTPFWFAPKDVAVCRECGGRANPEDVPTKDVWFRREAITEKRTYNNDAPLARVEGE